MHFRLAEQLLRHAFSAHKKDKPRPFLMPAVKIDIIGKDVLDCIYRKAQNLEKQLLSKYTFHCKMKDDEVILERAKISRTEVGKINHQIAQMI